MRYCSAVSTQKNTNSRIFNFQVSKIGKWKWTNPNLKLLRSKSLKRHKNKAKKAPVANTMGSWLLREQPEASTFLFIPW